MKVIVAGSRTIDDVKFVYDVIDKSPFEITEIVSGCALGVDSIAIQYAKEKNIFLTEMPAIWSIYGKSAGFIRNKNMGKYADAAIIIIEKNSSGSRHMKQFMDYLKKPVMLVNYNKNEFNIL